MKTNAGLYQERGAGPAGLVHINDIPDHPPVRREADGRVVGRTTCAICVGEGGAWSAEHHDPRIGWYVHEDCARRAKWFGWHRPPSIPADRWQVMSDAQQFEAEREYVLQLYVQYHPLF